MHRSRPCVTRSDWLHKTGPLYNNDAKSYLFQILSNQLVAVCCVAQNRVQNYVSRLVTKMKPRKVVVCMIYHPDERAGGSWADGALCCLGYNCRPAKLQSIIRKGFELGTSRIRIEGTEVRGVRVVR